MAPPLKPAMLTVSTRPQTGETKLYFRVEPDTPSYGIYILIKAQLAQTCVQLPGMAPPGDLERQLQGVLDDITTS